ncbi:thioesterase family protein, partial [Emergencia timonensis]
MLEAGIKGTQEVKVTEENTALTMGSGTLKVFATPSMIALMEKTAWQSV